VLPEEIEKKKGIGRERRGKGKNDRPEREKRGGRRRETQIVKPKIAVTSAYRRHWRCFYSGAKKNNKTNRQKGRERRGEGEEERLKKIKSKIAMTLT